MSGVGGLRASQPKTFCGKEVRLTCLVLACFTGFQNRNTR